MCWFQKCLSEWSTLSWACCDPNIHHHGSLRNHASGSAVSWDLYLVLRSWLTSMSTQMLDHRHALGLRAHDLHHLDTWHHSVCACKQTDDAPILSSLESTRQWSLGDVEGKLRFPTGPQFEKVSCRPTCGQKTRNAEMGNAGELGKRALGLSCLCGPML